MFCHNPRPPATSFTNYFFFFRTWNISSYFLHGSDWPFSQALDSVANDDPNLFAEMLGKGAASVVCVGMAVHRSSPDVQQWGCAVLGRLAPFTSDDVGDLLKNATARASLRSPSPTLP